METKELSTRYTVGTVSTKDKEKALHMLKIYAQSKMSHENIYWLGIQEVEKTLIDKPTNQE